MTAAARSIVLERMRGAIVVLGLLMIAGLLSAAGTVRIRGFAPLASGARPRNPAMAGNGRVYFTEPAANRIGELDPATGRVEEFGVPARDAWPDGITAGPGGWITFAERRAGKIGQFLGTRRVLREIPVPQGLDPHIPIVVGETVYFTAPQADAIGALNPAAGTGAAFAIPAQAAQPDGIVPGPGRTLYFCEPGADRLGRFELASHRFTEYPLPTAGAQPRRLAFAGDRLYFTEYRAGKLGRFDPATHEFMEWTVPGGRAAHPEGIAIDQRGRVWIAASTALVSFDPATSRFETLAIPWRGAGSDDPSGGDGITIGNPADNGDLWIALEGARRLAVVTPR